jgi:Raf kinase inhibitor-like YbhB/YbcL family protein
MKITSSAFRNGEVIPVKYTCDGEDVSPPLEFDDIPEKARSLALIMDDPDAPMGTWDHWLVWNIPPGTSDVPEGDSPQGVVGKNSWGKAAWGGPCPPDRQHRYFFKLYALDRHLTVPPASRKADLEKAMQGHILAQAQLMGVYDRKR